MPPDQRLNLVNTPGANAYPLVNYEYAIVSTNQQNPAVAAAMRKFLLWAIAPDETNDKYINDENFIPLPAHISVSSHDQNRDDKVGTCTRRASARGCTGVAIAST